MDIWSTPPYGYAELVAFCIESALSNNLNVYFFQKLKKQELLSEIFVKITPVLMGHISLSLTVITTSASRTPKLLKKNHGSFSTNVSTSKNNA